MGRRRRPRSPSTTASSLPVDVDAATRRSAGPRTAGRWPQPVHDDRERRRRPSRGARQRAFGWSPTGLVIGSAGNISVRLDAERFVVTAAGVAYSRAAAGGPSVVSQRRRLVGGSASADQRAGPAPRRHARAAGGRRRRAHPLALRRSVRRRPARPAVHLQREHRHSGRARARHGVRAAWFGRPRRRRPSPRSHRQPGSRAVLLANHGVVAVAPTLDEAYVVAQSVEWTAEICHLARTLIAAGTGEHVLDRAVQDAIARNYGVAIARRRIASDGRPRGRRRASTSNHFPSRVAGSGRSGVRRSTPSSRRARRSSPCSPTRRRLLPVPPAAHGRALALLHRRRRSSWCCSRRAERAATWRSARTSKHVRTRSPSCLLERGWRRGPRGAGACSATRWRRGSPIADYEGADPDTLLAGWPSEREAIVALTRPGSRRRLQSFPGQIPREKLKGEHESDQVRRRACGRWSGTCRVRRRR